MRFELRYFARFDESIIEPSIDEITIDGIVIGQSADLQGIVEESRVDLYLVQNYVPERMRATRTNSPQTGIRVPHFL